MTIRNSGSRRSASSKLAATGRLHERSRARRRRQDRRSLLQALEQRQMLAGPELAGIQPNEGSLLFEGTQLTVAPRELVFQFDDAADIDPATLDGIRITRAGDDNVFESAEVTTDFGTGGTVLVEFRAVQPGVAGNGIQIQLSSSSRTGSSLPIITVSGRTVGINLNSNPSRATKVQDLLVALAQHPQARQLITADQVSGASLAPIGTTVVSGTTLVLEGANVAQAITDLGTDNAIRVRVLAATSGPEGRGLRLTVEQRNFFGQALPIVLVENGGVRVLVNSAPGFETTAAEFIQAVNENPQASQLLQLRLEAGSGSTLVGNRTPFYSPLILSGASDIVVHPGFVGLGDTSREVVFRFAEPLPDDQYQIDIFGSGSQALANTLGEPFNDGQDLGLKFSLNLGPQVLAVVPEPVRRQPNGTRSPEVGVIEVHFNDDDLNRNLAQNPTFYRLYFTRDTADVGDDVLVHPTSVSYNAVTNIARLQFNQPLARFADPTGSGFLSGAARLKIGSTDALPAPPTVVSLNLNPQNPSEPGDSFPTAFDLNSQWNPNAPGTQSAILGSQIVNPTPYELQLPGGHDTQGVRDMRPEDPTRIDRTVPLDYLRRGADSVDGITTVSYDFAPTWLGDNPNSPGIDNQTPYVNVITEEQKQRVREVLQLFSEYLGIQFIETEGGPTGDAFFSIAVGDLYGGDVNATSGPGGLAVVTRDRDGDGLDDLGVMDLQDFDASTDDQFGGAFFRGAMLMVGQMLGYGLADDLPQPVTQSTTNVFNPSTINEPAFPSTADIVNGQFLYRPDSTDVDLYRFELNRAGTVSIQTIAERLASASLLDTALRLYQQLPGGGFEEIAFNDDYFSNDSLVELELTAGTYVLGVSASGNTSYDPAIAGTGFGGRSEGAYELRIEFRPTAASTIRDTTGVALDGDADGRPGGVYNFWFQPADPTATIYVDKAASSLGGGTINNPFRDLDDAIATAQPGQTVRVLANGGADGRVDTFADNLSYQVGFRTNGTALPDGTSLDVPAGVTLVVDAGVIFKMQRTRVGIGSTTPTINRSGAALQLLGTPTLLNAAGQPVRDAQGELVPGSVIFTSFNDDSVGSGNTPSFTPAAQPGDWGGLDFRGDLDTGDVSRMNRERNGVFLNHVQFADLRYGGGQVLIGGRSVVVSPVDMAITRPTIVHSRITNSADAAMAATPNTFTETRFDEPGTQGDDPFTPDYRRVGPDIHHNTVIDNSINGLFVRVATRSGAALQPLTAQARFDDTDIVHVLTENLVIEGTPGGPVLQSQAPSTLLVQTAAVAGGAIPAGTYTYKLTYVDDAGNESPASARTVPVTLTSPGSIRLNQLPSAPSGFVSRNLYRATLTVDPTTGEVVEGPFRRVAALNAGSTSFTDASTSLGNTLVESAVPLRARLDARLAIDPGTIVKLGGAGIDVTFGGQLLAEGDDGLPVVFTSLEDQRYGNSGTFDTHNGGANRRLAPGDWSGIYVGHAASASLDHVVVAGAGGVGRIQGGFASFNPIEVHQGTLRLANSRLEHNADGRGLPSGTRVGRGDNAPGTLFALASTPIVVNNTFVDGGGPALSFDVNSLSHLQVEDSGRSTGPIQRIDAVGNSGPLVRGNRLGDNDLNALQVRGGQLTTEGVWDDTDIVHVVTDTITIPNQFVYGGLRLQSSPRESLVVKFANGDEPAAIVAGGSLLTAEDQMVDIRDRIGGSLQAVGFPDFPVITTSLFDDSVGAGFDPQGNAQLQTASSTFSPGTGVQGKLQLIQPNPDVAATAVGRVGLSTDALGVDGSGQLQVQLPAGSRIEQAYLHVPTRTFTQGPAGEFRPGAIGFGGRTVPLTFLDNVDDVPPPTINFGVGFADVTSIVRSGVTFAGGTFNFDVDETITGSSANVEGTALTVIYSNPSLPIRTVLVLNGGLTTQQSNLLTFDQPIDPTAPDFLAEMRLGIAYSTGLPDPNTGIIQSSLIDINGQRLTSAAGGFNDGQLNNGELITYGGIGDNPANPVNPNDPAAADDEYYTLTPLLTRGDTEIVVTTENPSNDDSIFLSTFVLSGVVSLGPAPAPGDWTGLVIREGASDRNVAGVPENEAADALRPGLNPQPGNAQFLGELAANEKSGDENRRLGFVVDGLISSGSDADVYAFIAEAGTEVWFDIDRTGLSLDSIVELIDANGQILALSNDSLAEQRAGAIHFISDRLNSNAARPMSPLMQRGETQRITIGENIVAASGSLSIGLAGSSNTALVSVADFLADPAGAVQLAINQQFPSLGGVDVTLARRTARQVDASGALVRRGDDFVLEVRFRDSLFLGRDIPNLSVDGSALTVPGGAVVSTSVVETTDASELQDQYSTNPRDAGMRVVLPGEAGSRNLYHVRVRSSSAASDAELGNLMQPGLPGVTRGGYQLQIRLREADEFPGTHIKFSDVRYATNGLQIIGQPFHSPLLGDDYEQVAANETLADAQQLGMFGVTADAASNAPAGPLQSDNLAISVGGTLSGVDDIDWYEFDVRYEGLTRDNAAMYLATVFDLDYADNYARADMAIYVFNAAGQLVLTGGDSNISEDQPRAGTGTDSQDLSRGSAGTQDPFIGTAELPEGQYFVAVSHQRRIPQQMDQYYVANATNPLLRLEPIDSVRRIAEDRIGSGGRGTASQPQVPVLFDPNSSVKPLGMDDLVLYTVGSTGNGVEKQINLINPFTGQNYGSIGEVAPDFTDFAFAPNGELFAYNRDLLAPNDTGWEYYAIDSGDASLINVGPTVVQTFHQIPPAQAGNPPQVVISDVGLHPEAITFRDNSLGFFVANRPTDFPYLGGGPHYFQNLLYMFDAVTGEPQSGPAGDRTIRTIGQVTIDDRANGAGTQVRERGYIETGLPPGANPISTQLVMPEATTVNGQGQTVYVVDDGDGFTIRDGNGVPYRFEFNSGPEYRIDYSPAVGRSIRDGDRIIVTSLAGTETYEFNTGPVLTVDPAVMADGASVTLTDTAGTARTFEFDNNGVPVNSSATLVSTRNLAGSLRTQFELADALADAINASPLAINAVATPGTGRVGLTGDSQTSPPVANGSGIAVEGSHGVPAGVTPIHVEENVSQAQFLEALSGAVNNGVAVGYEGGRVNFRGATSVDASSLVSRGIVQSSTGNAQFTAGSTPIPFLAQDRAEDMASRVAVAVNGAGLTGITATTNGRTVVFSNAQLNGSNGDVEPPFQVAGIPPGGRVTGIAMIGNSLFAVSNAGGLYQVDNPSAPQQSPSGSIGRYVGSATDLVGIPFTGLVAGPENADGGKYADLLFGVTAAGTVYAFNRAGELQPVFAGGQSSINIGGDRGAIQGLAFSTLDYNLWHVTQKRALEPGHGVPNNLSNSRTPFFGGSSFYFGYENLGAGGLPLHSSLYTQANNPTVQPRLDGQPVDGTYNFPGGASGALVSNAFDLGSYAAADQPYLYFNYFLETDGFDSIVNDGDQRRDQDAFRVYVITGDGVEHLVSSNNTARGVDNPFAIFDDEFDDPSSNFAGGLYNDAIDVDVQQLFDNTDSWRQARVPLSEFAGLDDLRLRVEFSTAARMDTGDQGLRALAGSELRDGQQIVLGGQTFELAFGPTLVLPPGSALADFYAAADAGVPGSAPNTRVTVNVGGRTFVLNDGRRNVDPAAGEVNVLLVDPTVPGGPTLSQLTAAEVASILAAAIAANPPAITTLNGFDFTSEPNDELSEATPIPSAPGNLAVSGQGTINTDRDVDLFRLDVTRGTTVSASASSAGAPFSALVRLFDAAGNELARGGAAPVQYTAVVDGPIYVGISSDDNSNYNAAVAGSGESGDVGTYNVSISLLRDYGVITNGNRVEVTGGVTVSVPPGSPVIVDGAPGTSGLPIYVNSSMTAEEVAQAIRDAVARQFANGETGVYRVHNDTLSIHGISVDDPGPFGQTGQRWGDFFGDRGATRAQENTFEGVYVDDFIIGFAERGEMARGATTVSAFIPDPSPDLTTPSQPVSDLVTGSYQLEIRDASEYVASHPQTLFRLPSLFRTVDTNDRLSEATTIVARPASELVDGMTFTLSDGGTAITFEFDLVESGSGIQPGRVRVPYTLRAAEPGTAELHPITGQPIPGTGVIRPQTAEEVAASIIAAINSPEVQQLLEVSALPASGIATTADARINLFNAVSVSDPSDALLSISRSEGRGDANRQRTSQGVILVENSQFAFNSQYGIDIVHDVVADVAGNTTNALVRYPRNLVELNTQRLATGVVVQSNVLAFNDVGGVRVTGIAGTESAADPVPFDRIVNNTIIGGEVVEGLSAPAATFEGLFFQQGTASFADAVANYNPLAGGGPAPDVAFTDPSRALGAPDAGGRGAEPTDGTSVVSLGRGGSITVQFTDNLLTGSGDALPDLAVFETGVLESVLVEVSRDGVSFFQVGIIGGLTNTLDIDAAGFTVQDRFAFVRLTDLRQGDPASPSTGADIDAVGALSSVAVDAFTPGGVGITVRQNASPTLLNNIVANSSVGVDIDAGSGSAVLGGMTFYRNGQAITGASPGQFAQLLSPAEQVFVAAGELVFAPASGASIIDSSIDSLQDRASLVTVRAPLGLQPSPILAPTFDVNGQLRVDDPAVESPFGLGESVFKDRGASDRADLSGPRAVLLLPRADDSGNNAGVAEIFGKAPEAFEIQLIDGIAPADPVPGVGVEDSSVNSNSLLLLKDGVPLVEGVDYRFGYNPSTNVIRLTPLAGVWETDSVYLIRMLDASDAVLQAVAGANYTDGTTFDVIDALGNVTTFEYETGITITIPPTVIATNGGDGATFDLTIAGTPLRLELDNNGQVGAGSIRVPIPLNATVDDVASAVANLINAQQVVLQATALPGGRVRLMGGGVLSASDLVQSGLPVTGDIGTRVGFGIAVPANGQVPTGIADGQTFTISRGVTQQVTFELDNNNSLSTPGAVRVGLPLNPTVDQVAEALVRAIGGAGLGLNPQNVGNGRIVLGGSAAYSLDMANTALEQLGVPGQLASVPVVIPPTATPTEVAAIIAQAIEDANLPGITTSLVGPRILVEGTGGVAGAGALELGTIRDRVGNLLQSNQASGRTELTIFVGTGFDYGDAPAPYASSLADGGPRHSLDSGLSLGPNVTPDANARVPDADADDGVGINGPIQRGFDASLDIDVRNDQVGPAVLDVWVDWDADGVFEASEKTRFTVSNGINTIRMDVPATAATGTTYARFRLSSDGVAAPTGDAPDGEVEDWAILVQSNPFQNPALRADVNNSGTVTPLDALQIINALNRAGQLSIPLDNPAGFQLPTYPDVSGDGFVTALDALQVINELNRMARSGQPAGEGEAAVSYLPAADGVYASALTAASDSRLWADGSGTTAAVPSTDRQARPDAVVPPQVETEHKASLHNASVFDGAAAIAVEEVLDALAGSRPASAVDQPSTEPSPLDAIFNALGR